MLEDPMALRKEFKTYSIFLAAGDDIIDTILDRIPFGECNDAQHFLSMNLPLLRSKSPYRQKKKNPRTSTHTSAFWNTHFTSGAVPF